MFRPLLEQVRGQISGERALATVAGVARFHRVQASPGYDVAADWLAGELAAAGLTVEIEHVPADGRTRRLGMLMPEGWECTHGRATLVEGAARERLCDYATLKLAVIQRSAPARGRFPLVALEDGTEDAHYQGLDVRGRVVLTAGAVHRVHALAVVERGAAGILADGRRLMPPVRGPEHDREAVNYTSFWWAEDQPRGWGFVVSPAVGARLRARLRDRAALELEVELESRRFATRIPLLSGTLPGAGPEEVLVVSHLCHPEPSANDNGSGVAAALEAARALASLARGGAKPARRGVRFLWMPELTGTCAWLGGVPGRTARVAAALNLDMVGEDQARCGSTFLLEHPPCFAGSFAEELLRRIRDRAQDWVTSYSGAGHFSLARLGEVPFGGGSDHAVLVDPAQGVPCPMMIQWPDRFYHSSYDTPDRCDPASLALAARSAATYAGFLAAAGPREGAWLLEAVRRGALRRSLAALEHSDPTRATRAEALRGDRALASLARLGIVEGAALARARADLEAFATREDAGTAGASRDRTGARDARVPARDRAPLDFHRHLLQGYAGLGREERESLRRDDEVAPGGALTLEIAWQACDGKRSVAEIADLAWLETGHAADDAIGKFFGWMVRLGRARWADGREAS